MTTREYMLGNVAIARGLLEGGVQVAAGYPGTPSSEIIDTLASREDQDYYIEWSVNEKVAMEVAVGAAWAGVRSVVTMKHVGLNVAADPFMTLAYAGTKGGLIVIVADDPSCHSSQNEQDTRRYAQFALVPCFDPSTPQEAKDMLPYAFEFSEKFKIPVIFRPTTRISHGKSDIELGEIPTDKPAPYFEKLLDRWVMLPKNARIRHTHLLSIQQPIEDALAESPWNSLELKPDANFGVISAGIASVYAKEALQELGIEASFLKIGTYPVPKKLVLELLETVNAVLVFEELEPVVEEQVKMIAQEAGLPIPIMGKTGGFVPREGELDISTFLEALKKVFDLDVEPESGKVSLELAPRPPALCAGCSHRATFYSMRKVFGKDAVYPSDIGCYTLGIQSGTVETTLCMGSSISIASGLYHAGEKRPICCSIGDSTFFHTGMNSLLNAVFNKANITVTILDNRITAMTGHQPNPGVGFTVTGEPTVEVSLAELCRAMGAGSVVVVNPYNLEETQEAFKAAKDFEGTSVVIAKQPCVISVKRAGIRRVPYIVDPEKCEGCKQCVKFGCPAIEFDEENNCAVITALCSGCGVCAQICKFEAIREVKK
ncbi:MULTISPECIES: indolepyruvate ferredoxin oxidoreductase subunit alpha [unclassified Methanosarcina]|uniref:indolepyruvate ferredoxin oxidoreductase subunit alpha n=1 Tax=unclassified Methanosarcina TaxID=2644672 RepID=UPI00061585D9|nr:MULTISPECIES: indolepyruvate ferredoxin oxidoreductase subunit alpha [unclassified Methanosarcina]AKB17781.1 Indolepyruvate oxidoreductase subunit IorA [Methanosarcina sp. WWM596]AKB21129.1 Indolepyruvate oxidoreductase subunit IorA [Methanosarcina sp. WH1]